MFRRAPRRLEAAEVMAAHQATGGVRHGGDVEPIPKMPDPALAMGASNWPRQDPVPIQLPPGPSPGVEPIGRPLCMEADNLLGEVGVQPTDHGVRFTADGGLEGGDLGDGVDAGVGSPGSGHRHRLSAEDTGEGVFNGLLDGQALRLALPTKEARPIPGERQLPSLSRSVQPAQRKSKRRPKMTVLPLKSRPCSLLSRTPKPRFSSADPPMLFSRNSMVRYESRIPVRERRTLA